MPGTTADLSVRTVKTAADLPTAAWDSLAGADELYLSTPWMRMLEATSGATMRYLLADDGSQLVGGLATARADHTSPWLSGRPDTLLQRCLREQRQGADEVAAAVATDPATALLPATVCGGRHLGRNRVVTGGSRAAVERLVAAAEDLARDRGDRSVSFLYVDQHDRALHDVLGARGYRHFVPARYSWLPVPAGGFPDYLAARSGHRRRRITSERRRLRDAGVVVDVEPIDARIVPRMAELETNLLRRYGMTWSADLSEAIFSRIAAELGQVAFICGARRDGALTGFILLVERGTSWYAHRAGFDYDANGELPVYFDVTYYRPVELAAERGIATIHYGTGSDATKASRGCLSTSQHAYVLPVATTAPRASSTPGGGQAVIRPLDRYDTCALDELHRLLCEVTATDLPDQAAPCRLDTIGAVRFGWPGTAHHDLLAYLSDRVVGAVRVVRPSASPGQARLEHLVVHPSWRRRGIGTALLQAAWDTSDEVHALTASLVRQHDDGPRRDPAPERFARARGAVETSHLSHLRLELAGARTDVTGLLTDEPDGYPGYALRHWCSAVPEPLRDGVAHLLHQVGTGADPAAAGVHLQGMERMRAGRQRHTWETGVWHRASGALVAWSSLTMTHSVRDRATQGMTVVDPDHRRRGLGRLVKQANIAHAAGHEPDLALVDTYNAATNTPVVNLNLALGYRRIDELVTWRQERTGS
jgi:uncharacterized protein